MQGAGGVGGLLMIADGSERYLPAYDTNGNVHAMIKASNGAIAVSYEYDAFGRTLREHGEYKDKNPFRFSTKYTDLETGLIYYGLRYYSPSMGRFINRDPIGERGGLNLYAFVGNNGVSRVDYLGMETYPNCPYGYGIFGWGEYCEPGDMLDPPDYNDLDRDPFDNDDEQEENVGGSFSGNTGTTGTGETNTNDNTGDRGGDDNNNSDNDELRKECQALAGIISHFQGEAGKALDRYNSQLAYSQRLRSSLRSDNRVILADAVAFVGDMGGDLAFDYGAGKLLPGGLDNIAGALNDSIDASSDEDAWSTAGHLTLATYLTANYLRPSIYRSPNFGRVVRYGGFTLLLGTIAINAYEHFGATVYNEWQQARIMEDNNRITSELMSAYLEKNSLVSEFQEQYKSKGCEDI